MVNSAFFRLGRTISRVEEAVAYLGTNAIKQVALAAEVFAASDGTPAAGGFSLEQMQRHSLLTAGIVAGMFREKKTRDEAFTAGLLHDVGKLVLATQLPALVEVVISLMSSEGLEMHVAERQMTGISHAEVGAYLLALWGLPYPIVEAVANHHDPERVDQRGFELVDAVHVADVLANEVLGPAVGGLHSNPAGLSPERVDRFGVSERIPEWRAMAAEQAAALSLAAHA
jgi:putative nucleotidyltransferase with HDIG domain